MEKRRVVLSALQIPSCSSHRTPDLEGMLPDTCPLSVQVFWPFFLSLLLNSSVLCVLYLKSAVTLAALRELPHVKYL